ncbi:fimbrial protein [Klebsiella aerogenes]
MAPFIKPLFAGMTLMLSGAAASAATTEIKANIVDGSCQVSLDNASITFDQKDVTQFATGTAQILPLGVNLNCVEMQGKLPSLSVTGESSGLTDTRLFRAASSTAKYAGFMLKKGTLTSLNDFYHAADTVAPGDIVAIAQDQGSSVQPFSVGLVRSAGDPMLTQGNVNARITFAFIFP